LSIIQESKPFLKGLRIEEENRFAISKSPATG
jgi:hypothetical protein